MHKSKDPEVTTIQKNDRAKRILQSNTLHVSLGILFWLLGQAVEVK